MRTAFCAVSGICHLLRCRAQGQDHREAAAFRSRLVSKFTTKAAHNRSGNVKPEAACLGTRLKLPEEILWRSDTSSGIFESNYYHPPLLLRGNSNEFYSCGGHSPLAVFGQVQENLNQSVPIGPN